MVAIRMRIQIAGAMPQALFVARRIFERVGNVVRRLFFDDGQGIEKRHRRVRFGRRRQIERRMRQVISPLGEPNPVERLRTRRHDFDRMRIG